VRYQCLDLCLALERQGDGRLLDILDAAEGRSQVNVHKPEGTGVEAAPSADENKSPPKEREFSRWTGEPLGAEAGLTQSPGQGQKP
jgi:hypothetical protein